MVKTVMVVAMPIMSVSRAVSANVGSRRRARAPYTASRHACSSVLPIQISRASSRASVTLPIARRLRRAASAGGSPPASRAACVRARWCSISATSSAA